MKDIIRMNKLAGTITESQAKRMMGILNENEGITLNPQQKKAWEDAMIKRFKGLTRGGAAEEAVYDIPYAVKDILANILLGRKPNKAWEEDFEDEDLEEKGINVDEFESYADALYDEFTKGATNDKDIKNIQSWVKTYFN